MYGFGGFGSGGSAGGSTGGWTFGAKPPEQTTGGFSIPTTTATTTTSGLTFGSPAFGGSNLFGNKQQTPVFGGFGAKPTTTATTSAPTGFTFGATTTTTPAPTFGTLGTNTSAPTFGTPTSNVLTFGTSTPNTNTPTFRTPTTSTALPAFGSLGKTTFGFGTLGTQKTTAPTGFTLPTATTTTAGIAPTTTSAATPMFNFGTSSAATTSAPLTFGLPTTAAATTAPTLTFGTPSTSTTSATTTAQTGGFTFTQPTTTTSLTFGVPKTTGGLTFGTGTIGFGTTTASTTTPTFNLGTSTGTSTLGTGLFGAPKTDSTSVTSSTTTTTTALGLGGVDYKQTTQGLSGSGTTEPKHAKDHALPDPILQTLNDFQNFTKQQKSISVEISHGSSKPLKKVQEDTEAMESLLTTITSGLTRNAIAVDKLKTETAQGLHQAEMAQRNHETPPGLEYSAPADYFNDLVTKFETDTVRLRVQIEASEKHLRSLTQSSTISPQELTLAMRRLHETFIVLAARVQGLHNSVQSQKEQYKNLRRVYFKDDINIFENDTDQNLVKKQTIYSLRSLTGPTPFSDTPGVGPPLNVDGLAMLASSACAPIPTTSSNPSWVLPLQGTTNSPNFLSSFQPLEIPGFQLSKPPTGNKRSRR